MACGNSAIESSMGSAAKLATATSKMGGAIEQSSVKSSTPDRDGWDRSRQYLVYLRCSCGTRMQTSGGDTFFDAWLKDSRDQRRMQTSRQPCDTMPAHNARNRSVQDGGLQCILGPAPCLLKIVGKFAIDEHSSFRQASSLPLTLSFVRVTSTTTTPTLNTADPCHEPQHTLKLPRPSSRLQGTPAPGNCNGIPGVLEKIRVECVDNVGNTPASASTAVEQRAPPPLRDGWNTNLFNQVTHGWQLRVFPQVPAELGYYR